MKDWERTDLHGKILTVAMQISKYCHSSLKGGISYMICNINQHSHILKTTQASTLHVLHSSWKD